MPDYFETGFSVREPMWHGKGDVLDAHPEDWDEARMAAGLMWEPQSDAVYDRPQLVRGDSEWPMGTVVLEGTSTEIDGVEHVWIVKPIEGFQRITRDDTGDTLAIPRSSYSMITHAQMGELMDAFISDDAVKYETAGSVRGGRSVWALARLDEPWQAPGDESLTFPYAVFLNAHDGSAACKVMPTSVRVVCQNTWNAASAEGERTGQQVVIRHTGDVDEHLSQAKRAIDAVRADAKVWQMTAEELATINVSDGLVRTFLDEFIPIPENASDRTRDQREERRQTFRKLYAASPTTDGIRGTAYGVVQAAGEYLDHLRPYQSADTYLARTMMRPEPIKGRVISLVKELADV